MQNIDLGPIQDSAILFIVVVLLGGIVIRHWIGRAERKAEQKRPEPEGIQEREKPEKRHAA